MLLTSPAGQWLCAAAVWAHPKLLWAHRMQPCGCAAVRVGSAVLAEPFEPFASVHGSDMSLPTGLNDSGPLVRPAVCAVHALCCATHYCPCLLSASQALRLAEWKQTFAPCEMLHGSPCGVKCRAVSCCAGSWSVGCACWVSCDQLAGYILWVRLAG